MSKHQLEILEVKKINTKEKFKIHENLPIHPFTGIILAPTKSGKTNFLVNLIMSKNFYPRKYWDEIIFFSPTATFDASLIHLDKMDNLIKVSEHQDLKNMTNYLQIIMQEQVEAEDEKKRILLIFDDCVGYLQKNSDILNGLVSRHRHYSISMLFSVQQYRVLPPILRSNCNFIIIFRLASDKEKEKLYDELGDTMTRDFLLLLDQCTQKKYNFMYANMKEMKIYHNFTKMIWEKQ